jgi:hypothetical protein
MSQPVRSAADVVSSAGRMPLTPTAAPKTFKEILEMLMYEELTRARIRDMEEAIEGQRSPSRGARRLAWWPMRKPRHSEHRSRRSSKIA